MAANMKVGFTSADVSIGADGKARLMSASLIHGLVKTPKSTLSLLGNVVAPITLDDISIDELGRVVVDNQPFVASVRALAAKAGDHCGNNCSCND